MSNITADSMLGDLLKNPMNTDHPEHQTHGKEEKTESFAYLNIFQSVTIDIRGLQ